MCIRDRLYGGMIEGVGPRYCPSIEDKVVRLSLIHIWPSGVPERTYAPRDAENAAPVAPKRTERVDEDVYKRQLMKFSNVNS